MRAFAPLSAAESALLWSPPRKLVSDELSAAAPAAIASTPAAKQNRIAAAAQASDRNLLMSIIMASGLGWGSRQEPMRQNNFLSILGRSNCNYFKFKTS